jgi:hypothetical protein
MQQGYSAWTCSIDMQHGHAAWTCSVDIQYSMSMQYEHAARTCSKDMQLGHAARTCDMDMDMQYGYAARAYVQHGNAERTLSMDMQHRLAARTCNSDTQHGHEVQKFRTDIREDLGSGTRDGFQCDAAKGGEGKRLRARRFRFFALVFLRNPAIVFSERKRKFAKKSASSLLCVRPSPQV